MKIKLIALCIFVLLPFPAVGAEKAELAKEIIELTNVNKIMDQVKAQALQMQNNVMAQFDIPEDQKEKSMAFQKKLHDRIFEIMGFEKMEKEYIDLFTSVYTTEELEGIVVFYKSPTGRSMVEKQPIIIRKVMELTQGKMEILIPEIEKMSKEFEETLKGE